MSLNSSCLSVRLVAGLVRVGMLTTLVSTIASAALISQPAAPDPGGLESRLAARLARLAIHQALDAEQGSLDAARILLEHAMRLAPDDAELVRQYISACEASGDHERAMEGRRRLLRLEPADAVNQFEVVAAGVRELQSADSRLEVYERFLAAEGRRIDPRVRSRLAYDGAILQREQGHDHDFMRWIDLAVRLDPYNIQAVALRALVLDDAGADRRAVVEALMALVRADPVNPQAVSDLGAALSAVGAWRPAAELLESSLAIWQWSAGGVPDSIVIDLAVARAGSAGLPAALTVIDQRRNAIRQAASASRKPADQAAGSAAETETSEGAVELPPSLESARLILAHAAGSIEAAQESLGRLEQHWEQALKAVEPNSTEAFMIETDRLATRLFLGQSDESARETLGRIRGAGALRPEALARYEGWIQLREGDPKGAAATLRPGATRDAMTAIGYGLANEALDDRREAGRAYLTAARLEADDPIGIWAFKRLEAVMGRPMSIGPSATDFAVLLGSLPARHAALIASPDRWIGVRVSPQSTLFDPWAPVEIKIEVSNQSSFALVIGNGRALNPRLVLLSNIDRVAPTTAPSSPLIVNLSRRFVIPPGESLTIPVRIDQTIVGEALDQYPFRRLDLRFRALINYRLDAKDQLTPTLLGVSRDAPVGSRVPLELNEARLSEWVDSLDASHSPSARMSATAAIGAILDLDPAKLSQDANVWLDPLRLEAIENLRETWPSMSDVEQALTILVLPRSSVLGGGALAERVSEFEAQIKSSTGPHLTLAWLSTRDVAADDPILLAALRSGAAELQAFAAIMADRAASSGAEPSK